MATVTGLTAARMLEIEDASIVDGEIVSGNLILTKHDGTTIDAGPVLGPEGPIGPAGPAGGLIPGEVRLWPGGTLPELATYGKWVWADGTVYLVATYPKAAAHIGTQWRTFAGASDPGVLNFRAPDLRGLVPAGLDAMPGGVRANRMTRAVAIVLAGKAGEETHVVTIDEMPQHVHGITDPGHIHGVAIGNQSLAPWVPMVSATNNRQGAMITDPAATGITINPNGGNGAHENVQPTVFVPYIVKLDD
jgi:microcystin-dependent protein